MCGSLSKALALIRATRCMSAGSNGMEITCWIGASALLNAQFGLIPALAIVPLMLDTGRAATTNLSLDTGLLAAIDEAATARGLTGSAFLASAVREKIASETLFRSV